jgi:DNA-binding NarL/FixJ family response regulator
MRAQPIRIVVADDHRMLLESLKARIDSEPDMQVVTVATDAEAALAQVELVRPDVLVLDIDLPGRGVFDVVAEHVHRLGQTRILYLSGFLSDVLLGRALALDAAGYILKGEPVSVLLDSIRRVADGQRAFSKEVEERLEYDKLRDGYRVRSESPLSALTARQLEVLRLLAKGQSVKQVARTMHLSEKSVDSHKYRLMNKLGIHDRVELARYAIREGLTNP